MQQVKISVNPVCSVPEDQYNADSIDCEIGTAVDKPARLHAAIVIADELQKECRSEQRRNAEQQHRNAEPRIHNADMINRKCKCAQQRTGLRESCTAEALCQKSAEERFLKKGIDQRDVRKNEQTILFRELFLLHEILEFLVLLLFLFLYQL